MPVLVLACRICPKSIEGTMYACLLSVLNFGSMVSLWLGSGVTTLFNVDEHNFENLYWLVIISTASSVCPIFFIWMLSENENENENKETS